jgi:ornithine cyclodeaminase
VIFRFVTGRTVSRLLAADLPGCVDVVRKAYLAHASGLTVTPHSVFLRFPGKPNARIIGLPAHLGPPWRVSGMKWIASYPDNIGHGLARASAVLILNDDENGYPVACLEGSIISAARTAASAVLAAEHLMPDGRHATTLAVIGTGLIARSVYRFLLGTGWTVENVRAYDINSSAANRFVSSGCLGGPHASAEVMPDVASAVRAADLVLFATVAGQPHVHDAELFAHRPVVLHLSLRDLAPELILSSCNIVDDVDHVMRADTSVHLAEKMVGSRSFVAGSLADVMEGRCSVDHSRSVVFSPFGLGLLDVAVGKWLYDRAIEAGEAMPVPEFFGDLDA